MLWKYIIKQQHTPIHQSVSKNSNRVKNRIFVIKMLKKAVEKKLKLVFFRVRTQNFTRKLMQNLV